MRSHALSRIAVASALVGGLLIASGAVPSGASSPVSMSPAAAVVTTFDFTGSAQTWTVPRGVTSIDVVVKGAQAGDMMKIVSGVEYTSPGGKGGSTSVTLPVTPGDTLTVVVGGKGGTATLTGGGVGGFNGGGDSGITVGDFGHQLFASAGGGASDIRIGGTSLADRVVVAGGGGGTTVAGTGGDGGPVGGAGAASTGGGPGRGGTGVSGGAGGAAATAGGLPCPAAASPGQAGTLGNGGDGGAPGAGGTNSKSGGAGGGGGYYGGGGGGGACDQNLAAGPGGGGSGYAVASATNLVWRWGDRAGDGVVTITYQQPSPGVEASVSGRIVTGDGFGFPASSEVTLTIGGVTVGTTTTNASGEFVFELTDIDCTITGGTLTATSGATSASTQVTLDACADPTPTTTIPDSTPTTSGAITPTPAGGVTPSALPMTGSSVASLLGAGLLLVVGGASAVAVSVRRRRAMDGH